MKNVIVTETWLSLIQPQKLTPYIRMQNREPSTHAL